MKNNKFVKSIMTEINNLNDIGGPATAAEVLEILIEVQNQLAEQIKAAKEVIDSEIGV